MVDEIKEIKDALTKNKLLVGANSVQQAIREKKLIKVYLAANCPRNIREDIDYNAKIAEIPVVVLDQDNEELGITCKKNFFIAVLGITNAA